jgi:hypothetical protein
MQNLTLHLRGGKGVKFIYHDLQDVLFDPTMYFCNRILKTKSQNPDQIDKAIREAFLAIDDMQMTRTINSQGERVLDRVKGSESSTVVSFWRRYIRNLGDYTRIYNLLAGDDYFLERKFEEYVLNHLDLTPEDLGLADDALTATTVANTSSAINTTNVLKKHLFWCLDRYYTKQNDTKVKETFEVLKVLSAEKENLSLKDFSFKLQNFQYVASGHFPTRTELVNKDLISNIVDLHDGKVFLFHYDSKPVILIKLSYPTDNFEFGQ